VLERPRRRVERLEEAVVDGRLGPGERVEKRRLADVRVARERDRRRGCPPPLLPPRRALRAQALEAPLDDRDLVPCEPAVGLELALPRPPRPDAPAEALQVLPHAAHAREVVLELGELDLELALRAPRVLGEDVEDELCTVDDAGLQRVLERALLRRRQFLVGDQHLGARVRV
jgi:hypothetical protein